jgi:hypothetical protein
MPQVYELVDKALERFDNDERITPAGAAAYVVGGTTHDLFEEVRKGVLSRLSFGSAQAVPESTTEDRP